ncbi:hypothetical protein FJT64_027622 [Amphibalanus amphitrite]|uniref:Uncharacterized protein n=1 Tax=Amphibalanus amphitrite TaxID=1232801 RepID=A0A6A4W9R3_AMPAM|nr:hypothetical protein FJT64_027622 [Amphibalanus amphitrite]
MLSRPGRKRRARVSDISGAVERTKAPRRQPVPPAQRITKPEPDEDSGLGFDDPHEATARAADTAHLLRAGLVGSDILYRGRQLKKDGRLWAVWSDAGKLKAKARDGDPTTVIRSFADLARLVGDDPVPPPSSAGAAAAAGGSGSGGAAAVGGREDADDGFTLPGVVDRRLALTTVHPKLAIIDWLENTSTLNQFISSTCPDFEQQCAETRELFTGSR